VEVAEVLLELGGVATRATLVRCTSRSAVDRALASGQLVVLARGRYALPAVDDALAAAHARSAVLSHTSAAIHHGWAVKHVPSRPHITVRRDRRPPRGGWRAVQVHYGDLDSDDVVDGVATSKVVTLQQCLRSTPFDEALAIADSALRAGDRRALREASALARGPGSRQVREVAELARSEAANPFESCLRAIALGVPGLAVEPQVLITTVEPWCRPDLVDRELRIVLEADSFAWHGDRAALAADARRYNLLMADGWLVLRFAYEHVMRQPEHVRAVLQDVVAERLRQRTAA
jgi:very-short-patch-repair endonuclease